jgi:hypothetical protein
LVARVDYDGAHVAITLHENDPPPTALIDHGADAHLCCYVACGDEAGTRRILARNPDAAKEILDEFNAVGYAIHSWQLGTPRIPLQHGSTLSKRINSTSFGSATTTRNSSMN